MTQKTVFVSLSGTVFHSQGANSGKYLTGFWGSELISIPEETSVEKLKKLPESFNWQRALNEAFAPTLQHREPAAPEEWQPPSWPGCQAWQLPSLRIGTGIDTENATSVPRGSTTAKRIYWNCR